MDFLSLSCNRGVSKLGNFIVVLWQLQVSILTLLQYLKSQFQNHWYVFLSFSILVWKQADIRGPCWGEAHLCVPSLPEEGCEGNNPRQTNGPTRS